MKTYIITLELTLESESNPSDWILESITQNLESEDYVVGYQLIDKTEGYSETVSSLGYSGWVSR